MSTLKELYGPISAGMQIDFFANARKRGKTCAQGHEVNPLNTNVTWSRHGTLYGKCRECERLRRQKKRAGKHKKRERYRGPRQRVESAAKAIANGDDIGATLDKWIPGAVSARLKQRRAVEPPTDDEVKAMWDRCVDEVWEAATKMAKDDHKKPWNYLRVKPEAEAAWDRFNKALERAYSDPDAPQPNCVNREKEFADYDEDDVPSAEEAYSLCYSCPLIDLCSVYAEQERPAWGVHAGEVWAFGEVVDN